LAVDKLLKEIAECEVGTDRLVIDPRAMIIDPEDLEFEKRELESRIGSTATGSRIGNESEDSSLSGDSGREVGKGCCRTEAVCGRNA